MKRIELQIKALSPLAISRQKPGGSISECEDYIPGSVIRGAIAGEILKQSGQQFSDLSENGGDFQALFLGDEPAIFQNAYPANVAEKGRIFNQNSIKKIQLLPTTALSSKNNPGFCRKRNGKCSTDNNGVFDSLIDRFCAEYHSLAYDPNCPKDGKRVEPYSKFYSTINGMYYNASLSKRLLTRVGINRRMATSEEEILYSIEVINESGYNNNNHSFFRSYILVPNKLEETANNLHEFINYNSQTFRLGGSTSRGLGKVEINAKIGEVTNNIEEKIKSFNSKLSERWKKWSIFGNSIQDLPKKRYFTIDLQADAILTENWQRTTVISSAMLQQFTGVDDSSLEIHAAYSSYDYRSGWNAAWGLMKDVELVTDKGAVYLFSTSHPEKWYSALANLELTGVGERICEGFGQVEICNEFHLVLREDAV